MKIRYHHKYIPIDQFITSKGEIFERLGYIRTTAEMQTDYWPFTKDELMCRNSMDICIKFRADDDTPTTIVIPMHTLDMTSPLSNAVLSSTTLDDDSFLKLVEELAWNIEVFYKKLGIKMYRTDIYVSSLTREEEDGVQ